MSSFNHISKKGPSGTYTADLSQLYADGYIDVTHYLSLNPSYNVIADIFDDDNSNSSMVVIDSNEVATRTKISFRANPNPKLINSVTINVGVILRGRIWINEGQDDFAEYEWDTGRTTYNVNSIAVPIDITPVGTLQTLTIWYDDYYEPESDGGNDIRLYGVSISGTLINDSDLFEFNDSVLSTKGWNSSRYDGKQLEGTAVNEFATGDSTYATTPVVRNLGNTFYVSSEIISLNNSGSGNFEDDTLQYIPGFSYVLLGKAITVNEDNSVVVKNINTLGNLEDPKSIGFRREYQNSIPIGSNVSLLNTDDSVSDRSFNNYNVYYNKGRLQPLFTYVNGTDITVHFTNHVSMTGDIEVTSTPIKGVGMSPNFTNDRTTSFKFFHLTQKPGGISDLMKGTVVENLTNRNILQTFFTGSLSDPDPYGTWYSLPSVDLVEQDEYFRLMDSIQNQLENTKNIFTVTCLASRFYGRTGSNLGAQKDYVVFDPDAAGVGTNPGAGIVTDEQYLFDTPPIITDSSASGFFLDAKDLSFLSTNEINSIASTAVGGITMSLSNKYPAQQRYQVPISASNAGTRISFQQNSTKTMEPINFRGDYTVSFLNQDKPALLLKLIKENEFPQGKGSKPLVVIPENLHPYIKDNLIYFMAKAGLDIGDRKVIPGLDQAKRYIDRIGWNPPKPAPTIILEEEREEKNKTALIQRTRLRKQQVNQNKLRRLEKLRAEEEQQKDRRDRRRGNRRDDRREEREERKARRQERRNNRRDDRQERRENRRENRQERRSDRRENRQNRRENRRNRRRRR